MTDGLSFTNEIRFDANEEYLYIVETCGQRISRMKVAEDGTLSQREVFGPTQLGSGGFPDGIAFDSHGNLWGTLVMSDQIFAITPEGDYRVILDDRVAETEQALEKAFRADAVTPDHMLAAGGTIANWFASVTFGVSISKRFISEACAAHVFPISNRPSLDCQWRIGPNNRHGRPTLSDDS